MLFLFSLCAPLLGTFFHPIIALLIVGLALFFKTGISTYGITLGIPTIIATLCWIVEQKSTKAARLGRFALNVMLPLACIIIFGLHPVGRNAVAYSLYWLIPPILFFMQHHNTWFKLINSALRITFITHAVGSILWLLIVPTTPIYWLSLIPIVAGERLRLATITSAMLTIIKLIERVKTPKTMHAIRIHNDR